MSALRKRRSRRQRRGLKSWNFWTVVLATVYCVSTYHWDGSGRLIRRGYYGRTWQQPWTKRIEGHLWGTHDRPPQPWADLVPGWRPDGRIEDVLAAGGARVVVQLWTVPVVLVWLEYLTIRFGAPVYNDQHNRGNPRRIPKWRAVEQRRRRDALGLPPGGFRRSRRGVLFRPAVAGTALVASGLVLLLGALAMAV